MEKQTQILNIPTAIIIAGAIIAGAIIWTLKPAPGSNSVLAPGGQKLETLKPVGASDHILGNPKAKIKIVEYSDTSCPYCKVFHTTMRKIMDEYGKDGNVAWVYRHFPIDQPGSLPDGGILHPNAGKEAQATECAANLGGNDKFWAYTNMLYDITPSVTQNSPGGLDQKQLPVIAKEVGLDVQSFNDCLSSGKFKEKVQQQFAEGMNIGIEGTPTSFIITPSNKIISITGAQDFQTLKQSIDALLADSK